ncbi:exodeoxyribonuclease V subunit alpha [Angustibacter sp. McL0619]|uniref:exodeoxyribonuclease V subunit alpha n=1 Tax=Angustibacter sp. McL0619 TaxID=3415676 RepID=UPI003CEACD4A
MSAETFGPRIALRAGPMLSVFNAAQLVSAADVHVAQRLGRLAGENDERVLLAVALAVRGARSGSVCIDLDDLEALAAPEVEDAEPVQDLPWPEPAQWRAAVEASPLVAVGVAGAEERPVRWVGGRLYLDRYWRHEQTVRAAVDDRLAAGIEPVEPARVAAAVHRVLPGDAARQRLAAATAALSRLTVLTGGPGTGKTTTVARLLAVLHDVAGPGLRVALAAPTGKAAARLQEAVRAEVARLPDEDDRVRVGTPTATTLHRLLGWRPGSSTRFRHDRDHHLPYDVVVVDETSMVSLPLMARLLEALAPQARLVLVGDPDQLASVEVGAVLGDLVALPPTADLLPAALTATVPDDVPDDSSARTALRNGVVRLEVVHRHGEDIGRLARAVRSGDADEVLAVLRAGSAAVTFAETAQERPSEADVTAVREAAQQAGVALVTAARSGDVGQALQALDAHRLLLAHRRGAVGVAHWAGKVQAWVGVALGEPSGGGMGPGGSAATWFAGQPLLVTKNDRDTGLFNGDTGVVVADGDSGLVAAFGDPQRPLLVRPHRLPATEVVYAMTVHRGQGSQFAHVSLLLPGPSSLLLTRELFYTAVTRAREHVHVVGTEAAVRAAVGRPVRRASGLRRPLS